MGTSIREHAGTGLVAAAVIAAALADGVFDPTAYAAASIVVWAAVIAGLGSRALPASRIATTAAVAGLCLAGITALAAASVAWASDQGRAFEEAVRASAYLGLFVLAACTASAEGRARWIDGLAAGLGIVAALAVLSHLQPGLLESAELDELIPGAAGRASYPVGYWNGLAALLAVAAVLLAHVGRRGPAALAALTGRRRCPHRAAGHLADQLARRRDGRGRSAWRCWSRSRRIARDRWSCWRFRPSPRRC